MSYRDAREIEPHWFVHVEVPGCSDSPWYEVGTVVTTERHVYLMSKLGQLLGVAALGDRVRTLTPAEWEALQH